MIRLPALSIAFLALSLLFPATATAAMFSCPPACYPFGPNEVRVMVPKFQSDNSQDIELGRAIATVLGLQIWQTLERPGQSLGNVSDGAVAVDWVDHIAPDATADALRALAAREGSGNGSQLVLWGSALPFADGYVILPWLVLGADRRPNPPQRWRFSFGAGENLTAEPPDTSYQFEPIILRNETVRDYGSAKGLLLYNDPDGRSPIQFSDEQGQRAAAIADDKFQAIEQRGDAANVLAQIYDPKNPQNRRSMAVWIRLPGLSEQRSEVIAFVAGVVRVYRGEWQGAIRMLSPVAEDRKTPTRIRIAAYEYIAMASAKSGDFDSIGLTALQSAEELMPSNRSITMYHTLLDLFRAQRMQAGERTELLDGAEARLHNRAGIFDASDPWFVTALRAIRSLRSP